LTKLLQNLQSLRSVLREKVVWIIAEFTKFSECFAWISCLNCFGIYKVCGMFCVKKLFELLRNLQSLLKVLRKKVVWIVAEFTNFAESFTWNSWLICFGIYQVCGMFCVKKLLELFRNLQSLRNVLRENLCRYYKIYWIKKSEFAKSKLKII
jgi:hypothetical protein